MTRRGFLLAEQGTMSPQRALILALIVLAVVVLCGLAWRATWYNDDHEHGLR